MEAFGLFTAWPTESTEFLLMPSSATAQISHVAGMVRCDGVGWNKSSLAMLPWFVVGMLVANVASSICGGAGLIVDGCFATIWLLASTLDPIAPIEAAVLCAEKHSFETYRCVWPDDAGFLSPDVSARVNLSKDKMNSTAMTVCRYIILRNCVGKYERKQGFPRLKRGEGGWMGRDGKGWR